MSKFMVIGDPHFSSIGIKSRVDNYYEACLDKLNFIINTCIKQSVFWVIITGDMFNASNNSTLFLSDIDNCLDRAAAHHIRFLCNVGNHDVDGAVFDTWRGRQLRQLANHPAFDVIGGKDHEFIDIDGVRLGFYGAYTPFPERDCDILVTHHFIMDGFNDPLVCYPSKVKKAMPHCKYMIAGHDHAHYGDMVVNGIRVLRPGSLMRVSSAVQNNRIPVVGILEYESGMYSEVPVSCAKPFKDIFMLETKGIDKTAVSAISKFVDTVKSSASAVFDIDSIISTKLAAVTSARDREFIKKDLIENGFIAK